MATGNVVYKSDILASNYTINSEYASGPVFNVDRTEGSFPSSYTITKIKVRFDLRTASTHNVIFTYNGSTSTSKVIGTATAANSTGAITYTLKNIKTSLNYANLTSVKLVGSGGTGGVLQSGTYITITIYYETTEPANSPSTFTLAASTVKAGGNVSITIKSAQTTNTHTMTVAFASYSGSVNIAAGVTTGSYTINKSWMNGMPNATNATGTVTLVTKDSGGTTIGSTSASFTLQVSDDADTYPTCTYAFIPGQGLSYSIVLDQTQLVSSKLLTNYSSIRFIVSNIGGSYGSSIRSATVTLNGVTKTATVGNVIDFGVFPEVTGGGDYVDFASGMSMSVTDSRGRVSQSNPTPNEFKVYNYEPFTVTNAAASIERSDSSGTPSISGDHVLFLPNITWFSGSSSIAVSKSVSITYTPQGASQSVTETFTDPTVAPLNGTAVLLTGAFAVDTAYPFEMSVTDGVLPAQTYTFELKSAYAFMYWDPEHNRFGFGCYPKSERPAGTVTSEVLEVGSNWEIYRDDVGVFDSLDKIGSFYSDKDTAGTSVASGAAATLLTLHLPYPEEGVYVCQASVNFGTAVNGTKAICITKSATNSPDGRVYGTSQVQSGTFGNSGNTILNTVFICTIDSNDTSGDIYLRVYQNSGSALTLTGSMYAVRIK